MIVYYRARSNYMTSTNLSYLSYIKGYSKDHMKVVDDMPASDWESYITVANHPEYPSATAAYCGAQAQVNHPIMIKPTSK